MSDICDGGPAFPQPCGSNGYPANSPYGIAGGGMSLREYYAGQALSGLMANENNRAAYDPESCASECIKYADALIKELGI